MRTYGDGQVNDESSPVSRGILGSEDLRTNAVTGSPSEESNDDGRGDLVRKMKRKG